MRSALFIAAAVALAVFCGFEIYHQTGMVHATRKNGFGCLCHSFDPTPDVNVWVSGPDSLRAGDEAIYRISLARTGLIGAGFNVAAYRGSLGVEDSAGTHLESESSTDSLELTHTLPRMANGRDTISWLFRYKAPAAPGSIDTIYSVANAVNNDTLPDGDFWNYGDAFRVRVLSPTSVTEQNVVDGFHLMQNYPNPFNPTTTIKFTVPAGQHTPSLLKVYDVSGKEVATLVNSLMEPGEHQVRFNAEGLASGVYLYRLESRGYTQTRKILLLR
ncbi:MAG: T9SS type A sorting domain-containing protein [Ignavibacteriae bacterium]|nr:T9SS type A sorting domain-containing protein [Ignavibacteriota bacterium]